MPATLSTTPVNSVSSAVTIDPQGGQGLFLGADRHTISCAADLSKEPNLLHLYLFSAVLSLFLLIFIP